MEILSFTGKSGTGKSYQAIRVCRDHGIDAIIDDGLLIYKNTIVAGASAKKCESKAKAMRTALFDYEEQRRDVQQKLRTLKPKRLLVLGTSDRMANWITDALELPRASQRIYIEEVTSEDDRARAAKSRYEYGEHVIPAPMGQLRRDFAGYFMHPQRFFRNMAMDESGKEYERTVVRPSYSYCGTFHISENVIEDIIKTAAESHTSFLKVLDFFHNRNTAGFSIVIDLKIRKTGNVMAHCIALQEEVARQIAQMTAFSVKNVDLQIKELVLDREIRESRRVRRHRRKKGKD